MRGVRFSADSGTNRCGRLISHTVEQNAVRTEFCRFFLEALNDFVYFCRPADRNRSAA